MARHRFLRNPHSPISSCSSSFWAPPCLHCARAVVKPFLTLIPSSWHICVNSCASTTEVAIEAPEWPGCSPQHSHQGRYPGLQPNFQLGAPVLPCSSSSITVLNPSHQHYTGFVVGEKQMLSFRLSRVMLPVLLFLTALLSQQIRQASDLAIRTNPHTSVYLSVRFGHSKRLKSSAWAG